MNGALSAPTSLRCFRRTPWLGQKRCRSGVPHGLIHDWVGAVFIPNATLDDVFAVVHDYGHYRDFYKPTVVDSTFLGRNVQRIQVLQLWRKKVLFVTALVETEYRAPDFRMNDKRWYGLAWSTRVQEIRDYGEPAQRKLLPDTGSGYIWRLYSISRYEERAGESVNPIVSRLSRNSLLTSPEQTREAVRKRRGTMTK